MSTLLLNAGGFSLEHLDVVRFYLFGDVKFLHLLALLMFVDILTGIAKAIKNGNLWSRKSLFGYARKILVFGVIILANVIDQILGMGGAVTYATVIFYIANEGLSILENLAQLDVLVPTNLAEKLKVIDSSPSIPTRLQKQIGEELIGTKVDVELKETELEEK
ncbi:toxin secretion/phage lysis holin [Paenisporosarcina sp. HGH0030]|uniref:phage holin family protein n=1 Tax=Paenisporosarcina sp. HGH0030 TaxID=1078085 RepID=UPI00034E32CC|nr:phage holin family protein [Paenisporosarcina sp. HGH0030]EPD52741.1 toxin secretion/phage lysis holin [Paenisporosarcina sp. HGH0030]